MIIILLLLLLFIYLFYFIIIIIIIINNIIIINVIQTIPVIYAYLGIHSSLREKVDLCSHLAFKPYPLSTLISVYTLVSERKLISALI